jgi:hypothetical protein
MFSWYKYLNHFWNYFIGSIAGLLRLKCRSKFSDKGCVKNGLLVFEILKMCLLLYSGKRL